MLPTWINGTVWLAPALTCFWSVAYFDTHQAPTGLAGSDSLAARHITLVSMEDRLDCTRTDATVSVSPTAWRFGVITAKTLAHTQRTRLQ
jgi:hypothetical protein